MYDTPHSWRPADAPGDDTPTPWEPLWNFLCFVGGAAIPCLLVAILWFATRNI
ncbi:hypothetical protein AB0K18_43065 [Nonomuraea sp. NPDC049421]|uniref:hypothetical protein n=1 Tax=Nonomuraea sp. NPDC049421 TaxID=3155275 RepID=UPI0034440AA3